MKSAAEDQQADAMSPCRESCWSLCPQLQPMQEGHATPSWPDMQDTILTYSLPRHQNTHPQKENRKMCEKTHQDEDPFLPSLQSYSLNLAREEERNGTQEEGGCVR